VEDGFVGEARGFEVGFGVVVKLLKLPNNQLKLLKLLDSQLKPRKLLDS
jgi:hypothetical protein